MPNTLVGEWRDRIERAKTKRRVYEKWWQANLDAYAPKVTTDPKAYGQQVNTNRDFAIVEQKKPQLFFQTPTLRLKPSPLMAGWEDAIDTHKTILNELLGRDFADVKHTIHQALFDLECPAGFGVTKLGYESATVDVAQETQGPEVPDPLSGAGVADPLAAPAPTETVMVPVPIYEEFFWKRVSPKKLLLPDDFHDTSYEDAPWIGIEFTMPIRVARERFGLPEDFSAVAGADESRFEHGVGQTSDQELVHGQEVWYKATLFDEDASHPQQLRTLVLIDGLDEPAEQKDSPFQSFDPTGRLTPDSMIGYPIHLFVVRDLSDSAYVPSDCTISRPQVNELNRYRDQQIRQRETNIPLRLVNADTIPPDVIDKIEAGDYGSLIPVPAEAFTGPRDPIIEMAKAQFPRENIVFEEKQDADIARTHALDANQAGVRADTQRTATELTLVQGNANVRLDHERAVILDLYLKGVTKFSAVVQRFLSPEQAAKIVGPQRAERWAQWVKQVPAPLAFDAEPDSQLRIDAGQTRAQLLQAYNMMGKDPNVNRVAILKKLAREFDFDQAELVVEQLPPSPPPPPSVSFRFGGEDLNPTNPVFPIVLEIMRQAGYQVSPQAVQMAQMHAQQQSLLMGQAAGDTGQGAGPPSAAHPGAMQKMERVTKHTAEPIAEAAAGALPGRLGGLA